MGNRGRWSCQLAEPHPLATGDTPPRSHCLLTIAGNPWAMSEINNGRKPWQTPSLQAIGRGEGTAVPSTIDLADGVRVVDLSDESAERVRRPQGR